MQYVIDVENVKCNGCAATIQNALRETGGVLRVVVDIPSGRVQVEADADAVSRDTLVTILTALGYPPKPA